MNLNEILNVSNKCVVNLKNVLEEVKSYKCDVKIDNDGKMKICFALSPKKFIKYIKKYDLDFNSEVYGNETFKLFVCLENVEFFSLIYLKNIEDEYLKKVREEELKIIEDFLKLD